MTWFIWRMSTWFCKHDFEHEESEKETIDSNYKIVGRNMIVSVTCKKCGWHYKYKKF